LDRRIVDRRIGAPPTGDPQAIIRSVKMARLPKTPIRQKRDGSPSQQLAEGPEPRVAAVSALIRQRRKIALGYRRSLSEAELHHLRDIDHQLAGYNIDIPAIEHRVAQRSAERSQKGP
jgi:hypothetical protein